MMEALQVDRVRQVPLFAYHHVAVVLQVATARVRSEQASADIRAREAIDRERALRYLSGRTA